MHVLHLASEVFPFSRSGGLADVLGALPTAQAKQGLQSLKVSTLTPWYACLNGTPEPVAEFAVPGIQENVILGKIHTDGVDHYFLKFFALHTPKLYGYQDADRFARFALACVHALKVLPKVDVLHAHDWQVGLVPVILKHSEFAWLGIKSVYTIHNLQYQGRWNPWDVLAWTGLPSYLVNPEGIEFYGDANFMKAGILFADHITTVSPTYAEEICTPHYGEGLHGVLQREKQEGRLSGILNGIDTERWDPSTDPDIVAFNSPSHKHKAIQALRQEMNFDGKPILGVVSRLAEQKGMDLLLPVLKHILPKWNVVILGSGDAYLEGIFEILSDNVASFKFFGGMNEPLAHRIYAGSDAFLMPSRFEPCGLSQMIAMRYGTLPVVRFTGGLRDTVNEDVGFGFHTATPESMLIALNTAWDSYSQHSEQWQHKQNTAMGKNFAWDEAAQSYMSLYRRLMAH